MSLDLTELLDGPTVVVKIGGMEFRFSEVPISALEEMQRWINREHPHPLDAVKPHLEGLTPEDRQYLLEKARQDARDWPPKVGTTEGAAALMGHELGQVNVLRHGLQVHHAGATDDDALKVYRALKRQTAREIRNSEGGESPSVRRIYAAIFGTLDDTEDEPANGHPKGRPASPAKSFGTTTSGRRNSG